MGSSTVMTFARRRSASAAYSVVVLPSGTGHQHHARRAAQDAS